MIIRTSSTLINDYGSISELARKSEEPIYITENGEEDLVVMNIDAFEKREQLVRLEEKLKLAELSMQSGDKLISIDEAEKRLNEIYKYSQITL